MGKKYISQEERRRRDKRIDNIAGYIITAAVVGLIIFAINACISRIIVTGG